MKARWIILVLAVLATAFYFFGPFRSKSTGVHYRQAEITRGEIDCRVSATGTLNPVDQVEIGSQVSGTIQRLYVDYNSRVKAGQVLAQIDPAMFRANKSQAEANVDKANVGVQDADRTLRRSKDLLSQGLIARWTWTPRKPRTIRKADLRQAQHPSSGRRELANTTYSFADQRVRDFPEHRCRPNGRGQPPRLRSSSSSRVICRKWSSRHRSMSRHRQVAVGQPVSFTVDSYPDREFEGHCSGQAEPIAESGRGVVRDRGARPESRGEAPPG